ncbi:hypothetical protein BaRGS_00009735 [Batillaria attramentaria]|uniref:Uncharacterized protein n=1 Tax=Batillaria attramentaria TaxID=370345 RepID=A0ABD0LHF4_9CAEN
MTQTHSAKPESKVNTKHTPGLVRILSHASRLKEHWYEVTSGPYIIKAYISSCPFFSFLDIQPPPLPPSRYFVVKPKSAPVISANLTFSPGPVCLHTRAKLVWPRYSCSEVCERNTEGSFERPVEVTCRTFLAAGSTERRSGTT